MQCKRLAKNVGGRSFGALAIRADVIDINDVVEKFLIHDTCHFFEKFAAAKGAVARKKDIYLLVYNTGLLAEIQLDALGAILANEGSFFAIEFDRNFTLSAMLRKCGYGQNQHT